MLRSARQIMGHELEARDGEMGSSKDFLFDDRDWVVRYLVADTRRWLPGRKILISPISLGEPDWNAGHLPIALSQEEIKNSPEFDTSIPISKEYEDRLRRFYGRMKE